MNMKGWMVSNNSIYIPAEIMVDIFIHLTLPQLAQAAVVSKAWNGILFPKGEEEEVCSPWRILLQRDYGSLTAQPIPIPEDLALSKKTWLQRYQYYCSWHVWSQSLKDERVILSENGHRARVSADAGVYLPVLSERPLTKGTHFFEFAILEAKPTLHIAKFGLGVDTVQAITANRWHITKHAVGWYNKGTLYNRGSPPVGQSVAKWEEGDVLGLLVCIQEREGHIRWFKNEEEVNAEVSITLPLNGQSLHLVCLMAGALDVRLKYCGSVIPPHYIQHHKAWMEFDPY